MESKIKIIIADDHALFREGIVALLEKEKFIEILGVAQNGEEALELCKLQKPDIIILDISMPIMNGLEVSDKLLNCSPNTKVIFLTMHKLPDMKKYLQKKNNFGLVLKENSFEDLLYAIKSISKGGKFVSPYVLSNFLENNEVDIFYKLSEREKEILKLLTEGFSSKEISRKLYISQKTVETHKSRIMRKFEVNKSTDLIKKVFKMQIF